MTKKITFNKAQYLVGENIEITINNITKKDENFNIEIYKLHNKVRVDYTFKYIEINDYYNLEIILLNLKSGNYGVKITLNDVSYLDSFDIVLKQSEAFRYGFLSDFAENDNNNDLEYLKDLKINAVQFYDWMFKHDDLISPERYYLDPLGRETDLNVIKEKINLATKYGIRPFAYGAIYAASKTLFKKHPDWALYTRQSNPMIFADWLHFMDVSKNSPWSNYIVNEFYKVAKELKFMGIHMDTYGYPKVGQTSKGKEVLLEKEIPYLINDAARALKEVSKENGVIFNAVNNWPIESVSKTNQDALYIEVWPPNDSYYDLYLLIKRARELSNKNVVLAAYMKPFLMIENEKETYKAENALLLAQAVIMASGGTQLVYGEDKSVLADSYYVNYRNLNNDFIPKVYKYTSFLVQFADLLYLNEGNDISMTATSGINDDYQFYRENISFSSNGKEDTIWIIIKESKKRIAIHMINLINQNSHWNELKNDIIDIEQINVKIFNDRIIKNIYIASPDFNNIFRELDFDLINEDNKEGYQFKIDKLHILNTIWLELE